MSKSAIQEGQLDQEGQKAGIIRKRKPIISTLFLQLAKWRSRLMSNLFRMGTDRTPDALRQAVYVLYGLAADEIGLIEA